jgi:lipopolysaccharide transport system ATP-binding protein
VLLEQGELLYTGAPKDVIARYHKLLFASKSNIKEAKRQIQEDAQHGNTSSVPSSYNVPTKKDIKPEEETRSRLSSGLCENYNPNLRPATTQWHEPNGAVIKSVYITCSKVDFKPINRLIRNNKYTICYKVHFERNAFKVKFCTSIKTISGLDLGGYGNAVIDSRMDIVESGLCAAVSLEFYCRLHPGIYFFNVGVLGILDKNEEYLHRGIDVGMFEVQHEPNIEGTGIIDFGIKPNIQFEKL